MEKEEETTANICGLIEVSEKEFPEIERVEELRKKSSKSSQAPCCVTNSLRSNP